MELTVGDRKFQILDNVPEEYTALEQAISRLFYLCGSKTLCGACFQGKLLDHGYCYSIKYELTAIYQDIAVKRKLVSKTPWKSYGCCGRCSSLSAQGCVQKPLGCASWQCQYISMLLPERISNFLAAPASRIAAPNWNRPGTVRHADRGRLNTWLQKKLSKETPHINGYPYTRNLFSYFRLEGFRETKLTENDLRLLGIAAKRVNRIGDWLERTGLNKPNWPLMEKITHAEPGVLR